MTAASAFVWYVVPALLGRAYDLKNESVGPDLFTLDSRKEAETIKSYMTSCEYKVVSDFTEASDFLDVDGKLRLQLKSGAASIEGSGNYLKETNSFEKRVDILIKITYETITKTLPPSSIKPIQDWQDILKDTKMTHYIRSIKYGGQLIASVQFRTTNEKDKETIKGEITGTLNSGSGSFGINATGALDKIREKVSQSSTMDINYYATVPIQNIPRSIEGLSALVQDFPKQTKDVNDGIGVPLQMEVYSLESLDKTREVISRSTAFTHQMEMLNEQLTDIRNSRRGLSDWLKTIPPVLPEKENDKIGCFATKLQNLNELFTGTIATLNLSPTASPDQFQAAFDAYKGDHEFIVTDMYLKDLNKLKAEILDATSIIEMDFGGSNYIYWGSTICPEDSKQLYSGVMSGNVNNAQGSSQYTCLPEDIKYLPDSGSKDVHDHPQLKPLVFVSQKIDGDGKRVLANCSSCRVPGKSTTTMISGKISCPEKWIEEYHGILVSTDNRQIRGEFVCLDTTQPFNDVPEGMENLAVITEVSPSCGSFPCKDTVKDQSSVVCVVCSLIKETSKPSEFML